MVKLFVCLGVFSTLAVISFLDELASLLLSDLYYTSLCVGGCGFYLSLMS